MTRFRLTALLLLAIPLQSQTPKALVLSGDYAIAHDPSIAKEGDTYYVFATTSDAPRQFPIRCSKDLLVWKFCGHVFPEIPAWIRQTSPKTRDLWAPDISFFSGKYHLYYAYSLFGTNSSGIALATTPTLDPASPKYRWSDDGLVLKSQPGDDFNAIDPNLILDEKGEPWLAYGSFWTGIKMRRIDPATGKPAASDSTVYSLARRATPPMPSPPDPGLPASWQAIEAPFIVHHGDYYYLFVAWDLCCRGVKSNYRTMVGRARQVTGPYLDESGVPMLQGGGTQVLFPNSRWLGPGGASVLRQPGGDCLVFHAYDAATGKPALQISTIAWEGDWPHATLGGSGESK